MSRTLGIDYGTKRIGLAISDELGLVARPLDVVSRGEIKEKLRNIASEYEVGAVVVGMPNALRGHDGESAHGARQLAEEVSGVLGLEVVFVDERFTTRMAEGALVESGMKRQQRKETVDKVAAAIILQTYLDARARSGNSGSVPDVESPGNQ